MDELLARALETARLRGARYADVRLVESAEQNLALKNGQVEGLTQVESAGLGVRVLVGQGWGFAATRELWPEAVEAAAALAVELARASATVPGPAVDLGPPVASRGSYTTPLAIDPFGVSIDDKLALLLAADAAMARVRGAAVRHANLGCARERKFFANSEGADLEQTLYEAGAGLTALAMDGDDVQRRSYPSPYRQTGAAGWEYVLALDLPGQAERVADEAAQLLAADPCPEDWVTTVIIGGEQLALQVHESCGHPAELDRVFGAEAAYAGTSFLTPDKLGRYDYGSPVVNLTADAVRPTGLGTYGWDDEGVPAGSSPLVQAGRFVGYLMSRETAPRLGLTSNGCMRAAGWNRLPLIRMPNVSLEPGGWALADLIADTDSGLYLETNRSWSIDDKRHNFQFGTELGYEIKGGKLGRLLRDCTYTGITPEFWNSCDAVCNADHWRMWGTPNCGKGQPSQIIHTGHGAAPARFRRVRVGLYSED
ncbi:MAG: TldD/PmbA family protein [Anaerolineales bacterium]|nr:TldD/PmbA family protein [Anaerolineales bacterium]